MARNNEIFGLGDTPHLKLNKSAPKAGNTGVIYVLGHEKGSERLRKDLGEDVASWQVDRALDKSREATYLAGSKGPAWVVKLGKFPTSSKPTDLSAYLELSAYGKGRDVIGSVVSNILGHDLASCEVRFFNCSSDQKLGLMTGIEVASYKAGLHNGFKKKINLVPNFHIRDVTQKQLTDAATLGHSINIARHLVNTPAGTLNPKTYADAVKAYFAPRRDFKVEVWDHQKLAKEGMGLILAVGAGAKEQPRVVHIKYRPAGSTKKPVAFVGKGVTFDTGGLDIKPSAYMRHMKKDMGGSAALVGLANWVYRTKPSRPCDIYLALAENSVDERSFRPGDVIRAKNGLHVEIHNTDAEGRLVMADVLTVASSKSGADEPQIVVDIATLTGAIKAGLGADIAGLFSNDSKLSERLLRSCHQSSEKIWPMPLHKGYDSQLKSQVADIANCSSGLGGAITAALFLQRFVGKKSWAHLDIYGWTDSPTGCLREVGASGQGVQLLCHFLGSL